MYDLVIKFKRNAQKNIGKNIAKSSLETYKQGKLTLKTLYFLNYNLLF